jgi:RHS repeat-associated protein
MQSPGSQGTRDASTPEIEEVFSLAADPQLAENSRQGSERKNRAFVLGFEELKSQTMQWGSWQASGRTASVPTVYLYDGSNSMEEVDHAGNVLARYTQGTNADEPLAELRSSSTSYYEADGLGSITSLSSSSGTTAATYAYDSFGQLTASTGSIVNPFQYTAREFDQETGIYEYRARYYDPTVGRFVGEDPLAFNGGTNFYVYVENSPLNFADPLGLCDPQCFAQLKYRPTSPGSPMNHAFWYLQGIDGKQHSITAGPSGPNDQYLDVWVLDDVKNNAYDNVSQPVWYNSGLSSDVCAQIDRMIQMAQTWPKDKVPYNWQGPNSNTFAHDLGTFGGFSPTAPPKTTGWSLAR